MNKRLVKLVIVLVALLAYELFNFAMTEYALTDLIGEAAVAGIRWVVILSGAFCLMDFAGAARFFPGNRENEKLEIWVLISAWFLVITFNSLLIWWGTSLALFRRGDVSPEAVFLAPMIVAVLAAVVRVALVGSIVSVGGKFVAAMPESIEP